ncbi:MAG: diaminopimelate decarboxylase [Victivallaceae bacterium]|nr:diaminopimelate decarboxylase [Victivallaceae bacterium]
MISNELLVSLAGKYGTPLFVYDGDTMLDRYNAIKEAIRHPGLRIQYAMKANYSVGLIKLLRAAGSGIDAVSPNEVDFALRLGFPSDRIVYTANNMGDAEFERVFETGVLMNIGSLSRLRKTAERHPGMRLCLRFNPDVVDGDSEHTMTAGALTKFGIPMSDLPAALELVRKGHLHVVGLHEHTGSGIQHAGSVYLAMERLMSIATRENFPELEFLDFGGGFKVPYKPDDHALDLVSLGSEIVSRFTAFEKSYGRELKILFEPGKFLSAECGHLVAEVNTIKDNRGRLIAGCNSGFPQLIRPMLYGAYHRIDNISNPDGRPVVYDVCGNICESGDRFAEQREIPEIREGDLIAIRNAGAYCYSMGGVYNLREMPPEVVVRDGNAVAGRRRLERGELLDIICNESWEAQK